MSDAPYVLFDGQWIGYRVMHVTGSLSHEDIRTGVVYGFLEAVRNDCNNRRIQSNKAAIAFDSRFSLRRDIFPGYKRKRHESRTDEELAEIRIMHEQLGLLRREILPEIGFPVLLQRGLESDDMIAQAARQLTLADCFKPNLDKATAIMVTADYDLLQCVTETIAWFNSARDLYLDLRGVQKKKGVLPSSYALVKALAGCSSDEVPGIKGVGEKTAIKFLHGTLKKSYLSYKRIVSDEGQSIKRRNLELVRLPYSTTAEVLLPASPNYDPKAFRRWSKRLGFASLLRGDRLRSWDAFFSGESFGAKISGQDKYPPIIPTRGTTVEDRQRAVLSRFD